MEYITIERDIPVLCLAADVFPDAVSATHSRLNDRLPDKAGRNFFGVSHADQYGKIVYFAAATELFEGEAEQLDLDRFVIKKGRYNSLTLRDYFRDIPAVAAAFQQLLADLEVDPYGYCLEMYSNGNYPDCRDLQCLVKLV